MNLTQLLQSAKSEEDVKDAYIKALGLKNVQKNMVDIQTEEIWFEAKKDNTSPAAMFAQLLVYVQKAHKKGEQIPPFLGVFDREKAAFMETKHALPLLKDKTIEWPKSASKIHKSPVTKIFIAQVQPYIEAYFVVYKIATDEEEFIQAVQTAIIEGKFIRTPITPDNLKQVFDKWVDMIGRELEGVDELDYALLFFADIMHDGKNATIKELPARLAYEGETPIFMLGGKAYELGSTAGYRRFWTIYHRPPDQEYRGYLLERRDSLLPLDERSFKGAFYTPLKVVDKAYDLLAETLGKNWQKNYIIWDMCCGVGNLEVKHSNHTNIYMSTLDQADIDVMKASRTCVIASRFQYDYLNDDIDDWGNLDYALTNKLPKALQQAIADSKNGVKDAKKILVLMNPPYAEATNGNNVSIGVGAENKPGVAKTKFAEAAMKQYGKASNELFTQFLARIADEMPTATIALFSKLKYVNSPNFEKFRHNWKARFQDGFIVHSKAFDGLKGNFPIGFLIWKTNQKDRKISINQIEVDSFDKNTKFIGTKAFYNLPNNAYLNVWFVRPRANKNPIIPLTSAIRPTAGKAWISTWSDKAVGYMYSKGNDLQNASRHTSLLSSAYVNGHGFYVTKDNLWQAAIIFAVRRLIRQTWQNDRDQFLQPSENLTPAFKNDCLIWMLFNGSNLTASANDLEWNNQKWSIVNHFIPFSELEVNANGGFESKFMAEYLKDKKLSKHAKAVLDAGREIWKLYFSSNFNSKIKNKFKLNRPDVGWYQIRNALDDNAKENATEFDLSDFKDAYEALSEKLRPQVYEFGFLKL
jgi:hypothetical protein